MGGRSCGSLRAGERKKPGFLLANTVVQEQMRSSEVEYQQDR
jgi:hypothetical protein